MNAATALNDLQTGLVACGFRESEERLNLLAQVLYRNDFSCLEDLEGDGANCLESTVLFCLQERASSGN